MNKYVSDQYADLKRISIVLNPEFASNFGLSKDELSTLVSRALCKEHVRLVANEVRAKNKHDNISEYDLDALVNNLASIARRGCEFYKLLGEYEQPMAGTDLDNQLAIKATEMERLGEMVSIILIDSSELPTLGAAGFSDEIKLKRGREVLTQFGGPQSFLQYQQQLLVKLTGEANEPIDWIEKVNGVAAFLKTISD